jgi:hypothetical protein
MCSSALTQPHNHFSFSSLPSPSIHQPQFDIISPTFYLHLISSEPPSFHIISSASLFGAHPLNSAKSAINRTELHTLLITFTPPSHSRRQRASASLFFNMAAIKSRVPKFSKTSSKNAYPQLPKAEKSGKFTKHRKGAAVKQIFRGKEMSLSGKFFSCGKTASHEQIGGWISSHGGTFVTEVTDSTTHLICSIEDFKKRTEQGKAKLLLRMKCLIVNF